MPYDVLAVWYKLAIWFAGFKALVWAHSPLLLPYESACSAAGLLRMALTNDGPSSYITLHQCVSRGATGNASQRLFQVKRSQFCDL